MEATMEQKTYNALLNTFMYGFGIALSRLIDMNLVNRQVGEALLKTEEGQGFLKTLGFNVTANGDMSKSVEAFADQFKELDITQRFNVVEFNGNSLVLDIGMCVFSSATAAFRAKGIGIPPCPVVGLLLSFLDKSYNKHGLVKSYTFHPELNASTFTIDLKDK
jgi:hypothetical protein